MNNYTDDPTARLDIAAKMSGGKPVLIGEFHQGFVTSAHKPYSDFISGYTEVNRGL